MRAVKLETPSCVALNVLRLTKRVIFVAVSAKGGMTTYVRPADELKKHYRFPLDIVLSPTSIIARERETKKSFERNLTFMKECKWYPVCPMKRCYEKGKLDKKWIERYCHGDWQRCVRYRMEENGQYHPDNMLPDGNVDITLQ